MNNLVPAEKAILPTLSAELEAWLRGFIGATDERYGNAPAITEAAKAEAARLVKMIEASLVRAPLALRGQWLARLGMLMSVKDDADGAKVRIANYAGLLDHPTWVFTEANLKAAARAFGDFAKFNRFPPFADIDRFLGEIWARERRLLSMLMHGAKATLPRTTAQPVAREAVSAILKAHGLDLSAPTRKTLGLNWQSPLSPEQRRRVRVGIDVKEQARREKEGAA